MSKLCEIQRHFIRTSLGSLCSHSLEKFQQSSYGLRSPKYSLSGPLQKKEMPTLAIESRKTEKNKAKRCSVQYWLMLVLGVIIIIPVVNKHFLAHIKWKCPTGSPDLEGGGSLAFSFLQFLSGPVLPLNVRPRADQQLGLGLLWWLGLGWACCKRSDAWAGLFLFSCRVPSWLLPVSRC